MWLDFARLAAAYSIVWLHTPRSPQLSSWNVLGRFAVPFFTAGAVFFVIDGLRRQPHRSWREYAVNRFRRIYVPFVGWSLIYVLLKLFKKVALPDQANDFSGFKILWTGTFWHLWFMPFVLVVTLATFIAARPLLRRKKLGCIVGAVAIPVGLLVACTNPPDWVAADANFALLAWQALPAACWGFAVALVFPYGLKRIVFYRTTTLIAIGGFATLVAWLVACGRNDFVENLSGTLLFIAALQPQAPVWVERFGRFGAVAFGIYLAHPLVIKTFEAVATKLHWPITWPLDLTTFAIAAIGSTWLAWALARWRHTRWLAA
ncbi:MAG TPA: acyltransferase [Pirellulales bacterium]|jgi:surface polysaccharide O-acyltransferase-like enzyme|nr:acyltransferase [Pirellulales bacterium]